MEKLLSRINESAVRDEVVAALLNSSLRSPNPTSPTSTTQSEQQRAPQSILENSINYTDASSHAAGGSIHLQGQSSREVTLAGGEQESLVSPLHIVEAAISANSELRCGGLGIRSGQMINIARIKDRLGKYFGTKC